MTDELDSSLTPEVEPQEAPGRVAFDVDTRIGADSSSGKTASISWGARSDVGLVRPHNEDSYLLQEPLFVVCDGMGGHAAGEVASAIAVQTIGEQSPQTADDTLLGAAVEAANHAVIEAGEQGKGSPGMGCTASAIYIEGSQMAVAHVGDSRVYLLRNGSLVRVTHDHSYVEELVDAGQITADEARTHPSRSVVTRALGSDPDMYADHFTLEVQNEDRIIICSDGLSGMIPDNRIEALAVSSALPQAAADNLVSEALVAGGSDNVTVIVVDVLNDGIAAAHRKGILRKAIVFLVVLVALAAAGIVGFFAFVHNEYYLANKDGNVAIYQGVPGDFLGIPLSSLLEETTVEVNDLPKTIQSQLETGISFASEPLAREAVESYRDQINAEYDQAQQTMETIDSEASDRQGQGGVGEDPEGATQGDQPNVPPATTGEQSADLGSLPVAQPDQTTQPEQTPTSSSQAPTQEGGN